ncbi:MAG TPA: hypothetical protein VHL09_14545, partial [Dehalococcoidia bacterium]|nr:hypothetical protein [Dehalococcoidia bacterium]
LAIDDRDPALVGSIGVLFGGGLEDMSRGLAGVGRFRREWVAAYLRRLAWAGLADRRDRLNRNLAEYLA